MGEMSGETTIECDEHRRCDVSFAVACYNAAEYLEVAVRSALDQQGVSVEVLIVDDGSTDASRTIAERLARQDPRVRALRTASNSGPGGARNVAIDQMRGQWYAILDADDILLPGRTRRLLDLAQAHDADMVADNLTQFGEGLPEVELFDIAGSTPGAARELGLTEYLARSRMFGREASPGYLKPMIRHDALARAGLRYNEQLRIGEDDEFVIRALTSNATYWVCGYAGYRYRKHDQSISHRLSLANLEKMVAAEQIVAQIIPPAIARQPAYRGRWKALMRALAFTRSIEALKNRRPISALMEIARCPSAASLYAMPIKARLGRLLGNR